MGIPLQFNKAELKKKDEDKPEDKPEDKAPEASEKTSEEPEKPEPPKDKGFEPKLCEGVCEEPEPLAFPEPCMMPDFCGIFGRALEPFMPQPAPGINININIDMSKSEDRDECDDFGNEPHATSFLRDRGEC